MVVLVAMRSVMSSTLMAKSCLEDSSTPAYKGAWSGVFSSRHPEVIRWDDGEAGIVEAKNLCANNVWGAGNQRHTCL
jgi:hypothetical protein